MPESNPNSIAPDCVCHTYGDSPPVDPRLPELHKALHHAQQAFDALTAATQPHLKARAPGDYLHYTQKSKDSLATAAQSIDRTITLVDQRADLALAPLRSAQTSLPALTAEPPRKACTQAYEPLKTEALPPPVATGTRFHTPQHTGNPQGFPVTSQPCLRTPPAPPRNLEAMPAEYAVYYHADCADGFTAAWAAATILGPEHCDLHPSRYDAGDRPDPYPHPEQKVLILDFSYPRPVMERLIAEQPYVRLFDHHQTALQNMAGLPGSILDTERSGAMITFQTLQQELYGEGPPQDVVPDLIRYTQDRDLWCWQLPDSKAINAYIGSIPHQLDEWDELAVQLEDWGYRPIAVQSGLALLRHQEQVVKAQAEHTRMMEILGVNPETGLVNWYDVPVANATVHASETAAMLLANYPDAPFAAVYRDTPTGRRWSLRSEDGRADVARVAEFNGGGGHRNAAGYTSPLPENL